MLVFSVVFKGVQKWPPGHEMQMEAGFEAQLSFYEKLLATITIPSIITLV